MKITITNSFFEENTNNDSPIVKLCSSNKLNPKISYWLSRVLKELASLSKTYLEEKQKLIEKWCDKKEDGSMITEGDIIKFTKHAREFNLDFIELAKVELELPFDKIEISLDKLPEGILNSYDYGKLENIIDFKES